MSHATHILALSTSPFVEQQLRLEIDRQAHAPRWRLPRLLRRC